MRNWAAPIIDPTASCTTPSTNANACSCLGLVKNAEPKSTFIRPAFCIQSGISTTNLSLICKSAGLKLDPQVPPDCVDNFPLDAHSLALLRAELTPLFAVSATLFTPSDHLFKNPSAILNYDIFTKLDLKESNLGCNFFTAFNNGTPKQAVYGLDIAAFATLVRSRQNAFNAEIISSALAAGCNS